MFVKPIRAFVGHSFAPEDKAVIAKILNCLDGISDIQPNFTWTHAERPEARLVTDKVLAILSDCNVFIAICMKKERVIGSSSPKKMFGRFLIREADTIWKTSDWVIQEMGLAVGLDMKLILLIEDGVRKPGGIQGDLEYVPFDRDRPELCLPSLMLMIGQPARPEPSGGVVQPGPQPEENEIPVDNDSNWNIPDLHWGRKDFEWAFMRAVVTSDEATVQNITEKYSATAIISEGNNRVRWAAFVEYAQLRFGKEGSVESLRRLAEDNSQNATIVGYLARVYEHIEEFDKAGITFERAATASSDIEERLSLFGEAAKSYQRDGDSARAESILEKMRLELQSSGLGESRLLKIQVELAESKQDNYVAVAGLEKILDDDPGDWGSRFKLAYIYSDLGINELSAYHYSRIPPQRRTDYTWNNFGVSLANLALPAKAISSYRVAQTMGNTLAVSNLANKLIDVGFVAEARAMCDEVTLLDEHHANVDRSLERLKNVTDEEDAKEKDIYTLAKSVSLFFREMGAALIVGVASEISSRWVAPECEMDVSITGATFVARGRYQRNAYGLLRAFGGVTLPAEEMVIEYVGELKGSAIIGTVIRKPVNAKLEATLLAAYVAEPMLAIISADRTEIRAIENITSSKPKMYVLRSA